MIILITHSGLLYFMVLRCPAIEWTPQYGIVCNKYKEFSQAEIRLGPQEEKAFPGFKMLCKAGFEANSIPKFLDFDLVT
ncbi:hypothetical protein QVD17_19918 [Tagetes erecta]|uniref:Uncharacterized protein n=1 Tax=Tagetes erecta TaxID=13708 RepID=A0AAD8KRT6_TARER|nr:hypothetical protein QVD17_19918 [Tagetes erecta]